MWNFPTNVSGLQSSSGNENKKTTLRTRRGCCSREVAGNGPPAGTGAGHRPTMLCSTAQPSIHNPFTQHESMSPSGSRQTPNAETGSGDHRLKFRGSSGLSEVSATLLIPGNMTSSYLQSHAGGQRVDTMSNSLFSFQSLAHF